VNEDNEDVDLGDENEKNLNPDENGKEFEN
jgi:hypothetical protein